MGVNLVQAVNRTAHCNNCGEVLLKIKPSTGCIFYYCVECNKEVSRVGYDKYETLLPTCQECGNDKFKARITVDEKDSSHEYWEPECVNCKGSPKSIYVDYDGKVINEGERQLLMMKDRVKELEEAVEELESEIETKDETINQLEDEVSSLNDDIEEKDNRIYHLEDKLVNAERQISKLEDQVSDLEWEIRRLED